MWGSVPRFVRPRRVLRDAPRRPRPRRRWRRWHRLRRWRCSARSCCRRRLPVRARGDGAVRRGAEAVIPLLGCAHVRGGTCWADAGSGAGFEGGEVAGLAEAGGVGSVGDCWVSFALIEIVTHSRQCLRGLGFPIQKV